MNRFRDPPEFNVEGMIDIQGNEMISFLRLDGGFQEFLSLMRMIGLRLTSDYDIVMGLKKYASMVVATLSHCERSKRRSGSSTKWEKVFGL